MPGRRAAALIRAAVALLAAAWASALAASEPIPTAELTRAPSAARVETIVGDAAHQGWGTWTPTLREAALAAYRAGSGEARGWYYLYRWSEVLATPERKALQEWIKAVNAARVGHPNMPREYPDRPGSLSARLSRETQLFVAGNPQFGEEFFANLDPVDQLPAVLDILESLHAENPAQFHDYASLGLAIALVFDVPPPPVWPHGQVSPEALPRRWPAAREAFAYWVRLDRAGLAAHRLRRLGAAELKFVVDVAAPAAELDWARANITQPLAEFAGVYDLVHYRKDRQEAGKFAWPLPRYDLATIRKEGGICVDQAYFASTAAKARGIPTLFFRGAGLDGRHAWFGYLAADGWKLACGRYADQKYVVGLAFDPQTWKNVSDYELLFLSERFRFLPTFRLSEFHARFAGEFLRDRDPAAAIAAAREAVNRDRRNVEGWNILLRAQRESGASLREQEGTLREAAFALQKYPDLEISFSRQLVEILRQRGELSLADVEEKRLAQKYLSSRSDLSVAQAALMMQRSFTGEDLSARIKLYERLLGSYGAGSAMDFFDKVTSPFMDHLRKQGQVPVALRLLEETRRQLKAEKGTQLEAEMGEMANRLRKP